MTATILTVFVGPGANGSGVAEIMALLNGVNYPNTIKVRTLFVKVVGVVCAVAGGLCVGKEGPLAHIGAITAILCCYIPFDAFRIYQNDHDKRTMIAAGTSAGVSAAFGSPIGGALFSYEISKPNTFWTFRMIWQVFFSSATATLFLAVFSNLYSGSIVTLSSAAVLKFGDLSQVFSPISDLPSAIIIGIVTAVMGSLLIFVNIRLARLRKQYITEPW